VPKAAPKLRTVERAHAAGLAAAVERKTFDGLLVEYGRMDTRSTSGLDAAAGVEHRIRVMAPDMGFVCCASGRSS
jgi:hypothetical protein